MDVFAMDISRFGDFATRAYTNAKVRENYSRRFRSPFPMKNYRRPDRNGRPRSTIGSKRGAVFGASFSLEHALWFAPEGSDAHGADLPALECPCAGRRGGMSGGARGCPASSRLQT